MGTAQKKAYVSMKQEGHVLGEDADSSIIVKNNLEKQTRLLQLSAATCVVDGGKVKLTMPSSKVTELASVLEELGSAQFIACTVNRGLIDLVAAMLDDPKVQISYRVLVGGMSAMEKEANRQDFQEGRAQCLLFTMGAGGEGLDMTAAGTMIRLQRSWSLIQNLQTERRFWRIGSERHQQLNLIDIVVPGTEEVRQLRVVKQKLARLEAINQDIAVIMANGGLDQARLESLQAEQNAIMAADDLTQEVDESDSDDLL
jgi:SNF2 family DNA or RNA helicase